MTDATAKYVWQRLAEIQAAGLDLRNSVDQAVYHAVTAAQAALSITKAEAGVSLDSVRVDSDSSS